MGSPCRAPAAGWAPPSKRIKLAATLLRRIRARPLEALFSGAISARMKIKPWVLARPSPHRPGLLNPGRVRRPYPHPPTSLTLSQSAGRGFPPSCVWQRAGYSDLGSPPCIARPSRFLRHELVIHRPSPLAKPRGLLLRCHGDLIGPASIRLAHLTRRCALTTGNRGGSEAIRSAFRGRLRPRPPPGLLAWPGSLA